MIRLAINILVSAAILAGCTYGYLALGTREAPERRAPPARKGVAVKTQPALAHQGTIRLKSNGVVVPFREIQLAAEVRGRVVEISPNLRTGRVVQAGEVLVRLDATEYQLAAARLEQQQSQLRAESRSLEIQIKNNAQLIELATQSRELELKELERARSLMSKSATSKSAFDAAQRQELTSRNALVLLQNQARELEAQASLLTERKSLLEVDLQRARFDLQRTEIKSAVEGVVVRSNVEEQSYLSPGDLFAIIEDTSAMEVSCNLTLDDMFWIWNDVGREPKSTDAELNRPDGFALPPTPVTITFEMGNRSYAWDGVLSRQGQVGLDAQTRTFPCRVLVSDPRQIHDDGSSNNLPTDGPRTLMRGMFVTVQIECAPHRRLLRVPDRAIRPGQRIWLAKAGKLKVVPVEVVTRSGELFVVDGMDAIDVGDKVIVSPVANVRDGLPVVEAGTGPRGKGGKKGGSNVKASGPSESPRQTRSQKRDSSKGPQR